MVDSGPYLFALMMVQDGIPWCMLFTDDVVLMDETRMKIDQKMVQDGIPWCMLYHWDLRLPPQRWGGWALEEAED
jgi:hypothetical protein